MTGARRLLGRQPGSDEVPPRWGRRMSAQVRIDDNGSPWHLSADIWVFPGSDRVNGPRAHCGCTQRSLYCHVDFCRHLRRESWQQPPNIDPLGLGRPHVATGVWSVRLIFAGVAGQGDPLAGVVDGSLRAQLLVESCAWS
jgi:hypothetical protein